ncbi:hypothetical protein [Pseudoxanthomonas sp. CF125]|uniref:hypothetical protein n=1 Tax=Pseudoxanthomonas sp. CF125 TaxID=1855303 RepID=UPI000887FFE6|nr:hypothetical protein [Pseudoxanthomonas sp. CF125]SDQ24492.1 hypothetical protein SAMN05216569_0268 [Pseudoxanthomonas sp. CF125]
MARLRDIPTGMQKQVASQLGDFLSDTIVSFGAYESPLEVHENFPVVAFAETAELPFVSDIKELLHATGLQHYQIAQGGQTVGFTITHENARKLIIDSYNQTGEANVISTVIDKIDGMEISDNYEASILDARSRHLGALVLTSAGSEPSLVVPFRVPMHQDALRVGEAYTSSNFMEVLAGLPESGGMTIDGEGLSSSAQYEDFDAES